MIPASEAAARGAGTAAEAGSSRTVIESVRPEVDAGRFPIKRVVGDTVVVEADIFCDGHDVVVGELLHREAGVANWSVVPMAPLGNDRWSAEFVVSTLGGHRYTVRAFTDRFLSFRRDFAKRVSAGQDVAVEILVGATLVAEAAARAQGPDATLLCNIAERLASREPLEARSALVVDEMLAAAMARNPNRSHAARFERELGVWVDRVRARFSAWYEMFPRSTAAEPGRHGTFRDAEARLAYVAGMGFDVLYLPPIHPIGRVKRKGKNNAVEAAPDNVGSPWAIGSAEGGHKAIHPELGTLDDFRRFVKRANELGVEVALDIALQCAPDHPYVKQHPEWFRVRPDGTVQYAENPPKKYEDIFPFEFENPDFRAMWQELKSIFSFWIEQGIKIFRVNNPHTKPFAFWEWTIAEIRKEHPDVLFLSEAFTRPRVMHRLAKLGYTQSYTYFTWRNTKWELEQYLTELTQTGVREFLRPNFWPNTPDILPEPLQYGGRPTFMARVALAATLSSSYGVYGPAYELGEARALRQGGEEYLDSEKYEIGHWDLARADSLGPFLTLLNRIRRDNPALHENGSLVFHAVDNEQLIAYSKATKDLTNIVLMVVNLDPHHVQSGFVEFSGDAFGLSKDEPFQVHDLLTDARYLWHGSKNFVMLDPKSVPVHVLRLRHKVRTEQDFDYYL